jgi:thiol-disulfide isomerase/thioredoxin
MSGTETSGVRSGDRWLGRALLASFAVGVAGVLYVTGAASIKPDDGRPKPVAQKEIERYAAGALAKLETPPVKRPAPETVFTGPADAPVRVADFAGQVVVLNLWATWCAPCVKEMPEFAKLQAGYPEGVRVIPVSIDAAGKLEVARSFIAENAPLPFHHSNNAALAWALEAKGFPTTVIFDKQGYERARMNGEAAWNSPEAKALIDRLAADPT